MLTAERVLAVGIIVLLHALLLQAGFAKEENQTCKPSSCGSIRNISHPFRLESDPSHCGYPMYELGCKDNRTILYLYNSREYYYYVEEIRYDNSIIRIVDPGLNKGNLSSTPLYSLASYSFRADRYFLTSSSSTVVSFVNYEKPVNSAYSPRIIPCDINGSASLQTITCALIGVSNVGDVPKSCRIGVSVVTQLEIWREFSNRSMYDLQNV